MVVLLRLLIIWLIINILFVVLINVFLSCWWYVFMIINMIFWINVLYVNFWSIFVVIKNFIFVVKFCSIVL